MHNKAKGMLKIRSSVPFANRPRPAPSIFDGANSTAAANLNRKGIGVAMRYDRSFDSVARDWVSKEGCSNDLRAVPIDCES